MKDRRRLAVETFGWYGAVALLAAYSLVSLRAIETGLLYHALNFTGALGVALAAFRQRSYQAASLEFIWAGVALVALGRLLLF